MKKNIIGLRFIGLAIIFLALSFSVVGGPFYVVVGTFSEEASARKFATSLRPVFSEASFRYDADRNLYYVHVMETERQDLADDFRNSLQKNKGFAHAWIYTEGYSGETSPDGRIQSPDEPVKLELYTGGSVLLSSANNNYISVSKSTREMAETPSGIPGMAFTFVAETRAGNSVPGRVFLRDRNGNDISAFKTEEIISFGGKQLTHTLALVCHVAGYHPVTKILDLTNFTLTPGLSLDKDGIWQVRFRLTKVEVDEVNLVYRKMFYRESAVLKSESKDQVDLLLSLVKTNPEWRIVIHSHCNPGVKRDILLPRTDPFDISEAVEKSGSDKQLTRARAEALSDYLVEHGIDHKRITEMGWGSLDLMVRETAENAEINERINVVVK